MSFFPSSGKLVDETLIDLKSGALSEFASLRRDKKFDSFELDDDVDVGEVAIRVCEETGGGRSRDKEGAEEKMELGGGWD